MRKIAKETGEAFIARDAGNVDACPVVVVPHHTDPDPRAAEIVVGVDGSETSMKAVGFALEEAAMREVGLRAIHVWEHPAYPRAMRPASYSQVSVDQEGARVVTEALAPWRGRYPSVPVVEQVVQGRTPAETLSSATVRARADCPSK